MSDPEASADAVPPATSSGPLAPSWKPIAARLRRLLGVLMEKAKSTPDAYPLSLAGLVTGANQKSNRHPLMNLTSEQVEDGLIELRKLGAAAEVQGSGRVAKYRHYGYNWMGVKGVEAAVMTELLLRGEQTAGDLRSRASRFEPIADLAAIQAILRQLMERNLVIALTPAGRGQVFSHNLYLPDELAALKNKFLGHSGDEDAVSDHNEVRSERPGSLATSRASAAGAVEEMSLLREQVASLRLGLEQLAERVKQLESTVNG